ncbi:MAG: YdeI/OmpD-associated family protein [Anaerolineae bacterium]|nr:YdeI/OmpD-associated family protein [Anaerolineae bacterium]
MTNTNNLTSRMNPKIEFFFKKAEQWKQEYDQLRLIVLDCGLTEESKWGVPCYASEGKNIVLMHGFKDYCALLFFKGVLLKDPAGILISQTENTQSTRQIRFTSLEQIVEIENTIKDYIDEAIAVEKAGLEVNMKRTADFFVPDEFQQKLDENPALKTAFEALTPGRQRGYLLYFSAPKQSKTRDSRIEKSTPRILDGKGLDD